MSKKLCCLVSLILVLGLSSPSLAQLEGYWPLDGDLLDASGNGRHGTWMGDPNAVLDPNAFELGAVGLGLVFDGVDDYVNIDGYKGISAIDGVQQEFSIANWFKTTSESGDTEMVTWGSSPAAQRLTWRVHQGRLRTEHGSGNLRGNTYVNDGEWHHGALVVTENANLQVPNTLLYVDGVQDTTFSGSNNRYNLGSDADVSLGRRADNGTRYWPGSLDEVYIFSRVLDADMVVQVMNGEMPSWPKADKPSPADGTMLEDTSTFLDWRAGQGAVSHDIYFGTTADLGPDQLVSQQTDGRYLAAGLVPDQTYYWRIDEVAEDGTVTTGDVVSLWTPPKSSYNPSIEDGRTILDLTANLTWAAGWTPIMHQVYFGTDADQVANAAGAPLVMDIGYDTGELQSGTTYYWRVDEFYGAETVKGAVWSFSTVPVVPFTDDPNLVAHWTMDEAAGGVVLDMSGNANHAVVEGGAQIVAGIDGGAMEFDGIDDYLDAGDNSINGIFDFNSVALTIVGQVNPSLLQSTVTNHTVGNVLLSRGSDAENDNFELGFTADGNLVFYTDTIPTADTTRTVGDGEITVGEWHQFVFVYDANAVDVYLDGVRYSTSVNGVSFDEADGSPFTIGDTLHEEHPYSGLVDDIKIFDKAMSPDEVRQTYGDTALAYDGDPAPGSTDVDVASTMLSWLAGDGAVEHDVYIGKNKAAVAAADASDASGIYRGRQAETTYAPGILDFDKKLFWRVDEVAADGTVTAGKIWSFSTAASLVIFEEPTALDYDNTADPFVSELSLDMDPAQNWAEPIGRVAINYTGNAAPGSVTVDDVNGTTTVVGRGADIWGTADEFQYAYTTLAMNGSMTVKVDSLAFTDPWSKAGIMVRETLDAGSAFAAVFATGENGVRFQARAMTGQDATSDSAVASAEQTALAAPVWIKIERMFPMINAYYSTDGVTFVPMAWNPQVIPMSPAPIYIGLAVTSHSGADVYAEAVFSELSSDGGVMPGPLASAEIGLTGNAGDPMYLVLEDASGTSAAVLNPDPAATQQASATDWIVELAGLGVDLTAVTRASLVIGDLDTGMSGGTGAVTVNSVSLLAKQPFIVWVSDFYDDNADGAPDDEAWVDMLVAQDYKVDYTPDKYWIELDDAKIALLNSADLVIVSRNSNSGDYDDGEEPTQWNSIATPLILSSTHIVRSSRWKWFDTTSTNNDMVPVQAVDLDSPIFDGVALDADNQLDYVTGANVTYVGTADAGNGTVIAARADNAEIAIAAWEAGVEFYPGSGQIAGGPRMFIAAGSQETAPEIGRGEINLTAAGQAMFLNAINLMLGD